MIKSNFAIILFFVFSFTVTLRIHAQQSFFLGVEGGVALSVPSDYSMEAIGIERRIISLKDDAGGAGFVGDGAQILPNASAGFYLGYGVSKYFAIRTGVDFFINVTDSFHTTFTHNANPSGSSDIEKKTYNYYDGYVNYTYSFLTIPILADIYFVNAKSFRMGFSVGPYFSIPIGDINAEFDAYSRPVSGVVPSIRIPARTAALKQPSTLGVQAAILSEIRIKNASITINLGFDRELYKWIDALQLTGMTVEPDSDGNRVVTIPDIIDRDSEQKLSVFMAPKLTVGFKYSFMFKNKGAAANTTNEPETNEAVSPELSTVIQSINSIKASSGVQTPPAVPVAPVVIDETAKYFIIVGSQAEGPLLFSDLQKLHKGGMFPRNTMVWKSGIENWIEAEKLSEFAEFFK